MKHHHHESHKEGKVTVAIEKQTSKVPSVLYLALGMGAMAASVTLHCLGQKKNAIMVGQWISPFLIMGLYNKIVKVEGHD